jgi:hypothetical protein
MADNWLEDEELYETSLVAMGLEMSSANESIAPRGM